MTYRKAMLLLVPIAIAGCTYNKAPSYQAVFSDPILFCKTVKKLNDVVLENNFPPVIASRNYVYASIAAYECIAAGDSSYSSLSGQIRHLPALPKPTTGKEVNVNFAALLAFTKVGNAVTFPEGSMMEYYQYLQRLADSTGMPGNVLQNSISYSDTLVSAIMRWSKNDNYAKTRTAEKYAVLNVEGRWIPTPPMYASSLEPHWNEIRPMTLDSAAQFMPARPPVFNINDKQSPFYLAMMEVKNTGDSLSDEQKNIADFWDDNPFKMNVVGHASYATKKFSPPGHWMNIVGIAAKKSGADFRTTVAAYAQTAIALFDAFICCWDEKFRSNYIRPETAINRYVTDAWRPQIQTPPFPSYVSGHATISAAAAEVMTKWFGNSLSLSDTSQQEFGLKSRRLESFRKASLEAASSRLYGGIHFRFDNEAGNKMGARIGDFIVQKLKLKK